MKTHPIFVILCGLVFCSVGLNICLWESNKKLIYKVQKLEAGPAKGLFIRPDDQPKNPLSDEEINDLLKQMFKKMIRERLT